MSVLLTSNSSTASGENSSVLPASGVLSSVPSPANEGVERGRYLLGAVKTEYGVVELAVNQTADALGELARYYDKAPAPGQDDTITPVDGHEGLDVRRLVLAVEHMIIPHPQVSGELDNPAYWESYAFPDLSIPFSRRLSSIENALTESLAAPPPTLTLDTIAAARERFRAQTAVTTQAILTIDQMRTTSLAEEELRTLATSVARQIENARGAFEDQVALARRVSAAAQQSAATQESAAAETHCCGLTCTSM